MILPLLTSLLLLAGAGPDLSDPKISTRGDVIVQSVGADEMLVVVDSSGTLPVDGRADYLFVYKAKGLNASAPRHFLDATVEYEPGLLRILVEGRSQRGQASWEWSMKAPGSRSLAAYWDLVPSAWPTRSACERSRTTKIHRRGSPSRPPATPIRPVMPAEKERPPARWEGVSGSPAVARSRPRMPVATAAPTAAAPSASARSAPLHLKLEVHLAPAS
jgi:hypothetical protein